MEYGMRAAMETREWVGGWVDGIGWWVVVGGFGS